MAEQGQPNPVTTMAIAAVGLHELYVSYIKAGFTEHQAFELVKVALAVVCQPPKGGA